MQKSYIAKERNIRKQWFVIDAENQVLGRMAVDIARILMGKHHPWYTPHVDVGDFVVVLNADKFKVTGKKKDTKVYYSWSGYPGGLKSRKLGDLLESSSEKVLHMAVRRMLPKNRLGRRMLKKLKIYKGTEHPHTAQCPKMWKKEAVSLKEVLIHE